MLDLKQPELKKDACSFTKPVTVSVFFSSGRDFLGTVCLGYECYSKLHGEPRSLREKWPFLEDMEKRRYKEFAKYLQELSLEKTDVYDLLHFYIKGEVEHVFRCTDFNNRCFSGKLKNSLVVCLDYLEELFQDFIDTT